MTGIMYILDIDHEMFAFLDSQDKYIINDTLASNFIKHNAELLQEFIKGHPPEVKLIIFANGGMNQELYAYQTDKQRAYITLLPLLQSYVQSMLPDCEILAETFMMADLYTPFEAGGTYRSILRNVFCDSKNEQSSTWVKDNAGITQIYSLAHRTALANINMPFTLMYYHHDYSKLNQLHKTFKKCPDALPRGITLQLNKVGGTQTCGKFGEPIVGTGDLDLNYEWTIRLLSAQFNKVNAAEIHGAIDLITYFYERTANPPNDDKHQEQLELNEHNFDKDSYLKLRKREHIELLKGMNILNNRSYVTAEDLCKAQLIPAYLLTPSKTNSKSNVPPMMDFEPVTLETLLPEGTFYDDSTPNQSQLPEEPVARGKSPLFNHEQPEMVLTQIEAGDELEPTPITTQTPDYPPAIAKEVAPVLSTIPTLNPNPAVPASFSPCNEDHNNQQLINTLFQLYKNNEKRFSIDALAITLLNTFNQANRRYEVPNNFNTVEALHNICQQKWWEKEGGFSMWQLKIPTNIAEIRKLKPAKVDQFNDIVKKGNGNNRSAKTLGFYDLIQALAVMAGNISPAAHIASYLVIKAFCEKWSIDEKVICDSQARLTP